MEMNKMANAIERYHHQLNFRMLDDFGEEEFAYVIPKVKGVNMLALNENDNGNASTGLMSKLEYVKEVRIKSCIKVKNDAIPFN